MPRHPIHNATIALKLPSDMAIDAEITALRAAGIHLLHADVLVSNETGFLKHAFGQIWLPQGKVLFTSEQFAAHISKMV